MKQQAGTGTHWWISSGRVVVVVVVFYVILGSRIYSSKVLTNSLVVEAFFPLASGIP